MWTCREMTKSHQLIRELFPNFSKVWEELSQAKLSDHKECLPKKKVVSTKVNQNSWEEDVELQADDTWMTPLPPWYGRYQG